MSLTEERPVKEFHLTMKLRNNLLRSRRVALGFTIQEVAEALRMSPTDYGQYENLCASPIRKNGQVRPTAQRIADFYDVSIEDLWPQAILDIERPVASQELSIEDMGYMLSSHEMQRRLLLPDAYVEQRELREAIETSLESLSETNQTVIRQRFGLDDGVDKTLDEVAASLGKTKERARQRESKGLHMLRHSSRAKRLLAAFSDYPSYAPSRLPIMLYQLLLHVEESGLSMIEMCKELYPLSEATILSALETLRVRLIKANTHLLKCMNVKGVRRWFLTESLEDET